MRAILEEDAAKASELEKKLEDIQKKNAQIAADLALIIAAKNPFASWAGSLSLALIELGKYGKTMADISSTTFIPGVNYNPSQNADRNYDNKLDAVVGAITNEAAATIIADTGTNNLPTPSATPTPVNTNPFAFLGGLSELYGFSMPSSTSTPAPAPTIIVNNNGSVIMQDEFVTAVTDAVTIGLGTGLKIKPPGSLPEFE
jgi:hypothetical protein